MTTPIVSASQEMIIPGHMPNTRPFAVEIKMDGKKPTALTKISRTILTTIAIGPKL